MTGQNFLSLIHFRTQTNSTTFTNAEVVLLANTAKDDLAKEVAAEDQMILGAVAVKDLAINVREYTLPTDMLGSFTKIEADLNNDGEFKRLEVVNDSAVRLATSETAITDYFNSTDRFGYVVFRNSLFVKSGSVVSVTGGLKIHYIAYPEDLTTTSLTLDTDLSIPFTSTATTLPRELHDVWATKVSILFKTSRPQPLPLTEREQQFELDLAKSLRSIRYQDRNAIDTLAVPCLTGYNY